MSAPDPVPPEPSGAPGTQPPRPALRRSTGDRMLFGVAGGLSRYLGVDPVVVRIAFVLLAVFGGSGVILYLVGLIAIPEEQPHEVGGEAASSAAGRTPGNALAIVGVVLIAVGGFALLRQVVPGIGSVVGPLVLLAAGVLLILATRR